jgi:hypothetical protein
MNRKLIEAMVCVSFAACGGEETIDPEPALPDAPIGGNDGLVKYPGEYRTFGLYATVDNADKKQVREVYANDVALASAGAGRGSIIVMELYGAMLGADQMPVLDSRGRFVKSTLGPVFIMEKREGFGRYSEATRNGEWEYGVYTAAGEPMASMLDCNACHRMNAGDRDFIFTREALAAWRTATPPIGGRNDLVAYPTYASYAEVTTVDRADKKQVRRIYANPIAVASAGSRALDRGSILVMEIYAAQLDADQNPLVGPDGRFIAGDLARVTVMEKQAGFGNYTDATRNGEWEYGIFDAAGAPVASDLDCYGCHAKDAGEGKDYIFSLDALVALE